MLLSRESPGASDPVWRLKRRPVDSIAIHFRFDRQAAEIPTYPWPLHIGELVSWQARDSRMKMQGSEISSAVSCLDSTIPAVRETVFRSDSHLEYAEMFFRPIPHCGKRSETTMRKSPRCISHVLTLLWYLGLGFGVSSADAGPAGDWEQMKNITPKGYVCGFASTPPIIDGRLDEALWQAAPWTDDFVDIEGDRKPKPRFRTRAKMLWDNEHFYISAESDEPHVWGTLIEHDAVIFQDNDFEVFIDPNGDNHEYYELEINALNTTWDLFLPRPYKDGGKADNGWEIPGLKSAVHIRGTLNDPTDRDTGWSVEVAIPWKVIGKQAQRPAPPNHGDQWRVNFSRVEWQHEVVAGKYCKIPERREDNWVWSPQGIIDMHRPERWGFVQFSQEAPGITAFVGEASFAGRELLMEVYHRQKSFHKQQGKWAGSLQELDFDPASKELSKRLELRTTEDGFQATLAIPVDGKSPERWRVRQDSRLWMMSAGDPVESALDRAGMNRAQLQQALNLAPTAHQEGMRFLIENMPDRDLQKLSAEFLLDNVRLAYQAWDESVWKNDLPKEIFLNTVLPYASINERRDAWRKDFRERFLPLISDAKTPSQAAAVLNQKVFPLLKVRYSTQRPKADQSPYESMKSGTASCTGLSVLLIDACRAVGVPARFVGTPQWSDKSGNHSWVEVWDRGWHFTGAAEPSGDELDKAWFVGRAAAAQREHPLHAIYATSFQRTTLKFPLVWDKTADDICAVNVTDRYVARAATPPASADANASTAAAAALAKYLAEPADQRPALEKQAFATVPLSKANAAEVSKLLWQDHAAQIRQSRAAEMKARELISGKLKMPFAYEVFGDKPATGRSLYLSMHGGGGAPTQVNDRQWENQKRLYRLEEGVYVAPRAPTDTWDLWHQSHIDALFDRLIENLIVFEDVDPNRVYLMGYSAGGDGVYQLAPRMADRWAAASMMAGHPNETSPLGLRNVAFAIHVGALDAAYNRNKVAAEWGQKLADLHRDDPAGYEHLVKIHEGKGHWMDREDAEALPWMAKVRRNPFPKRIVWKQDDVVQSRFYWLAVDTKEIRDRAEVVAHRDGQHFEVQSKDIDRLTIRLNDDLANLELPISITIGGKSLFEGSVTRTIATLAKTLGERGDPTAMFCGEVTLNLTPKNVSDSRSP